jgi:hypothetical protein
MPKIDSDVSSEGKGKVTSGQRKKEAWDTLERFRDKGQTLLDMKGTHRSESKWERWLKGWTEVERCSVGDAKMYMMLAERWDWLRNNLAEENIDAFSPIDSESWLTNPTLGHWLAIIIHGHDPSV